MLFVCAGLFSAYAQPSPPKKQGDSLWTMPLKDLRKIYLPLDRDSLAVIPYLKVYMDRAKKGGDSIEIAFAYMDMIWISPDKVKMQYADSIILFTEHKIHTHFPAFGYSTKGQVLYYEGRYEDALKQYIQA
ncbi:MAG: hypothetical protein AAFO99_16175, partial [Bacteroidota bacterium]